MPYNGSGIAAVADLELQNFKIAQMIEQQIQPQLTIPRVSKCAFSDDEWQFEQLHFARKEWIDKDGKNDPYYTLKFVKWEKSIGEKAAIEVYFAYKTEDGENYKLFETTCEIFANGHYIPIKTDKVWKLRELYKIITGERLV